MRVTKFGHACVRVEYDGHVLVIDPGGWTSPEAVHGAHAVLITHEHGDHYDLDRLRETDAPILTIEAVAARIRQDAPDVAGRVTVVAPDESVAPETFGGHIDVRAVGELHAVIHPEYDRFFNSGYVVTAGDFSLYHPGDALTLPGQDVDVLCVPVSAPWLKASEAIDFARAVRAPRNLAIHDGIYSDRGLAAIDAHLGRFLSHAGQEYTRLAEGTDLSPAIAT
jgi:L-ascorbate metabolism protein UlaG (beta-lactamase superfamily)